MKLQNGHKIKGTYSNGVQSWNFKGTVAGIHADTAGGNFSTARIELSKSFDNRDAILITLTSDGTVADSKYSNLEVETVEYNARILGINDDEDYCSCCGKTGLKRVVWIEHEDGSIDHYGTTCATYKLKGNRRKQNVTTVVTVAENEERRCKAVNELAEKHAAATRPEAARSCRDRNKTRKDGSWILYQGDITTLQHSEHGFYTVPADCTEKVDYLKRNGWEELS